MNRLSFLISGVLCGALLLTGCNNKENPTRQSKWISRIVEYRPAPGQFINTPFYGDPEAAESIVGQKGMVSLGGWGGYIVFEFDHTVQNLSGIDFVIHSNAMINSSEPGVVSVSPDGAIWYELKGSEYGTANYRKNYAMTYSKPSQTASAEPIAWIDGDEMPGEMKINASHRQSYWPLFLKNDPASLTFNGSWLASTTRIENGNYLQYPYDWGYADNFSDDFGEAVGNDPDTRNSNKFDLNNAVDRDGNPVPLTGVRFIRIATAVNQSEGPIGEISTEVCGAISLSANLR